MKILIALLMLSGCTKMIMFPDEVCKNGVTYWRGYKEYTPLLNPDGTPVKCYEKEINPHKRSYK